MKSIANSGLLLRLFAMALLVATSIASISSVATAGTIMPTQRAFQGASWEQQSSQRDDDDETPEDEVTPEDEETPEDDKDIPEDEETPDDDDTGSSRNDDDLNPDWLDAGLISETEYESPLFGYTVEWDQPWVVDDYYDDPENGDGAVATDVDGADLLYLWDPESVALVFIQGFESDGSTVDDIVEYLESPEFFTTSDGDELEGDILDIESDDETVAMVYWYVIDGDTYVRYLEYSAIDDGDAFFYATFSAPEADFEDTFVTARETIAIDGDEAYSVMRERTVLAALDDLP